MQNIIKWTIKKLFLSLDLSFCDPYEMKVLNSNKNLVVTPKKGPVMGTDTAKVHNVLKLILENRAYLAVEV
jgi:hypothetical protein